MHRLRRLVLFVTILGSTATGCASSRTYLAVPVTEDDCGEDLDRAIRGALVGAGGSYLLSGMITGFDRHTLYIGLAGGVVGFFGGLETDVQSCRRAPE